MTLAAIAAIISTNFIVPEIMSTFDVGYQSYGSYLQWITILGLFFVVLPDVQPSILA